MLLCAQTHTFPLRVPATIRMIAAPAAMRAECPLGSAPALPPAGPKPEGESFMPLVSMRQLLDEAAKGGYGVGAFNVNNMEQIQAIMEAAKETKSPVIIQASRGARAICAGPLPLSPDAGRSRALSRDSHGHAPGPRQQLRDLQERHRAGLHQRHDGRLAEGRRQDPVHL